MSMFRSFGAAGALVIALAMPAVAQTQPTKLATTTPPVAETPLASQPHAAITGPAGRLQKTDGMWRSSTLVGATVYNHSGQAIGTISDLLINPQGDAAQVVISVGGFLGIDSKLVELPFDQLTFEPSANSTAAHDATAASDKAPMAATSAAEAPTQEPTHAVLAASVGGPDYSVVLPGATKASLMKMPVFTYHEKS